MALNPEVQQWADGLIASGIPADTVKTLITSMEGSEKAQEYIRGNQLRQSDYSSKMNAAQKDLEKRAQDIATKESEVQTLQQRLIEWKRDADALTTNKSRKIEELETKLTKMTTRLGSLKEAYQIAEEDLADLTDVSPPAAVVTRGGGGAPPDTPSYLTREDFNREAASLLREFPKLSAEIDDIRDDHKELFGKRLPREKAFELLQRSMDSNGKLSARAAWEQEFKVGDRRTEIAEAERKEWERKIREDERTKVLSEAPPTSGPAGHRGEGSPVFKLQRQAPPAPDQRSAADIYNQPGAAVQRAVEAYRAGKYRGGGAA